MRTSSPSRAPSRHSNPSFGAVIPIGSLSLPSGVRHTVAAMSDLAVHEVLVSARNGMERDGFDMNRYGCHEGSCGSPRCAVGWVVWESGFRGSVLVLSIDGDTDPVRLKAWDALWRVRPCEPNCEPERLTPLERVEAVAWVLWDRSNTDGEVFAWFDRAIAATAPEPADPLPDADLLEAVAYG